MKKIITCPCCKKRHLSIEVITKHFTLESDSIEVDLICTDCDYEFPVFFVPSE